MRPLIRLCGPVCGISFTACDTSTTESPMTTPSLKSSKYISFIGFLPYKESRRAASLTPASGAIVRLDSNLLELPQYGPPSGPGARRRRPPPVDREPRFYHERNGNERRGKTTSRPRSVADAVAEHEAARAPRHGRLRRHGRRHGDA